MLDGSTKAKDFEVALEWWIQEPLNKCFPDIFVGKGLLGSLMMSHTQKVQNIHGIH